MLVCSQIFIIVPSKSLFVINLFYGVDQRHKVFAYLIGILSIVLLVFFTIASVSDPGYLKPEHEYL